jgi:hypothetical protein
LFDNIHKLTKGTEVEAAALHDRVGDAIHQAVRIILHGICYETVHSEGSGQEDNALVHPPMLSTEGLRIITGMLLPKLYPPSSGDSKANKTFTQVTSMAVKAAHERAFELWTDILMLLSPYSTELVDAGSVKRRRCKSW